MDNKNPDKKENRIDNSNPAKKTDKVEFATDFDVDADKRPNKK